MANKCAKWGTRARKEPKSCLLNRHTTLRFKQHQKKKKWGEKITFNQLPPLNSEPKHWCVTATRGASPQPLGACAEPPSGMGALRGVRSCACAGRASARRAGEGAPARKIPFVWEGGEIVNGGFYPFFSFFFSLLCASKPLLYSFLLVVLVFSAACPVD